MLLEILADVTPWAPGANIGSDLGISYLAISDQSDESAPHSKARWRRTSDSEANSTVVEESNVFPAGAYDGARFEIAIELTTGPRFWPSMTKHFEEVNCVGIS